jgi:peptidyl-prolyl cis-trans isomerase SurA
MMRKVPTFFCCLVLFVLPLAARAGDVLDRIVATINGHVILQSDWMDAQRYEAFVDGRPPDQAPEDPKAVLDKLIDQELLREQMRASDFPHATDEEIAKRVQEIRKQYPDAETEQGWKDALARYGLTEEELKRRVAHEFDVLRLVDSRLRPNVTIDSKTIESYYNQELLPQLRRSGAPAVALTEASPRIKEILTQQKMNELLVAWLQNLRSGSEIRTELATPDSGGQLR